MKYIGIFLIILALFGLRGEYSSREKRRLAECEGFLRLISHLRLKIGCYLLPMRELVSDLECPALEKSGFLSLVLSGASLGEAFKKCENSFLLGKEEKRILTSLFSSLGNGYFSDSVKLLDSSYLAFEELTDAQRVKTEKNIKLSALLFTLGSLGLLVLLI